MKNWFNKEWFKENWFRMLLMVAIFWFLLILSDFSINVCLNEPGGLFPSLSRSGCW